MFEELDSLFQSSTIRPTFEKVHILLALFIFDENRDGIGRYRLQKELLIGEGTAKSMIKKLNKKIKFISVIDERKRKGHFLTEKGIDYLNKIKTVIPIIKEGKSSILKDIIIETDITYSYFCLVKNGSHKISNGVSQRDAAIKISGSGATCLVFNGKDLIFPSKSHSEPINNDMVVNKYLQTYFKTEISKKNIKLEKNDVIAIGSGDNLQKARLATLNAALTLV
jgi:hypothetical protein